MILVSPQFGTWNGRWEGTVISLEAELVRGDLGYP